jgi:syntaxin-binding protein 5
MIIFSGGMPYAHQSKSPPSITVMTGKSITVLEMEHAVVDFVVLCETPWCHGEDNFLSKAKYIMYNSL